MTLEGKVDFFLLLYAINCIAFGWFTRKMYEDYFRK